MDATRFEPPLEPFRPLYYGDDEAGVTAHLLSDESDAGPFVDQRSFPLGLEDAVNDVYGRIAEMGRRSR